MIKVESALLKQMFQYVLPACEKANDLYRFVVVESRNGRLYVAATDSLFAIVVSVSDGSVWHTYDRERVVVSGKAVCDFLNVSTAEKTVLLRKGEVCKERKIARLREELTYSAQLSRLLDVTIEVWDEKFACDLKSEEVKVERIGPKKSKMRIVVSSRETTVSKVYFQLARQIIGRCPHQYCIAYEFVRGGVLLIRAKRNPFLIECAIAPIVGQPEGR